jgi:hypothetical protein
MLRPPASALVLVPLGLCAAACRKTETPAPSAPTPEATAPSAQVPAADLPKPLADALRSAGRSPADAAIWFGAGTRTVYRIRAPGAKAVALWQALRDAVDRTGHWPVIVGTDEDVDRRDDLLEGFDRDPAEVLAAAASLDVDAWLKRNSEEEPDDPEATSSREGTWPDKVEANTSYAVVEDLRTKKPHAEVWLALVPTREPADVPAYLPFGDWNACPPDHVHVALLRRWRERHGAELVCLSGDTLELRVARRPTSRDDAERLAREQCAYCNDVVDQGVSTIQALAADRMASPVWFFWWD